MKAKFTSKKIPYCVVFNPEADKQNLFVAGMADKKMICVRFILYLFKAIVRFGKKHTIHYCGGIVK